MGCGVIQCTCAGEWRGVGHCCLDGGGCQGRHLSCLPGKPKPLKEPLNKLQDSFLSPCKLDCNHLFCSQCLHAWMQRFGFSHIYCQNSSEQKLILEICVCQLFINLVLGSGSKVVPSVAPLSMTLWSGARARPALQSISFDSKRLKLVKLKATPSSIRCI